MNRNLRNPNPKANFDPIDIDSVRSHPAVKAVEQGMSLKDAAAHSTDHGVKIWPEQVRKLVEARRQVDGDGWLPERYVRRSAALQRKPEAHHYPVTVTATATATATRTGTYHTDIKLDSQAFATQITTATTDGASSAQFPDGSAALVNPAATPTSGDFVLTLDTRDNATAIKRLQRNGEKTLLMSLNPALDPIPAESPAIRIVGVVEEVQHTPYRRTPRR